MYKARRFIKGKLYKNKKPLAMDLFCGCGGLTQGLKQAGFNVIGAIDMDPLAVETYRKNHKRTKVWRADIRDLSPRAVMSRLKLREGELDLLAGCPPCQGFSTLRTLNGSKKIVDPRNDLVFEFLRFVEALKPKAIMMENVPGLATDKRIVEFCEALRALGYDPKVKVLDAADYGVPQRRRRMILLAGRPGPIGFAAADKNKRKVQDVIKSLPKPGNSGDEIHDLSEKRRPHVVELIKKIPKDGGSRTDLNFNEQLPCHQKCDGFKDIYGRMAWDKVAPTITSGCTNPSKGRFLHPEQDRAITLREAALLQTFPRHYIFLKKHGKGAVALMIGNALPPEFIKRHALEVVKYLRTQPPQQSGEDVQVDLDPAS